MNLERAWPALRPTLKSFSFAQMKDIVGAATLPIHQLHHMQQGSGYTSKGDLLTAIDGLYAGLAVEHQRKVVTYCIAEMLKRDSGCREALEQLLVRFGWALAGSEPLPLHLHLNVEATGLPPTAAKGVTKALRRYRDGDFDGAITAICGVVDRLTEQIYKDASLGDHKSASYNERVAKSYRTRETAFLAALVHGGVEEIEAKRVWFNQSKSVGQAGVVLGAFRREFGDVHGVRHAPRPFVQRALDSGVYIIRCLGDFS